MLVLWYFTWVFLMIRPFLGYIIFYLVALTLEFDPFVKKLNLAYNYWTVSTRALIFHMNITCDKTFLLKPLFLTLWSWPWSLTDFLKTLTLLITFEQWVLELWYLTWVFFVIRTFRGYQQFWPCDLDLGVDPFAEILKLFLLITFEQWVLELWYFTWVFLVPRPFRAYHVTLTLEFYLGFFKTLTLLITFKQCG